MLGARRSINQYAFAVSMLATVLLTKLASYLTPYKLYFSFSSFLFSTRSLFRWEALAIKLLLPCAVGFLAFYVPCRWMMISGGGRSGYWSIYRYLAQQSETTARAAGFFSALLLAWPYIIYWDVLMDPTLQHLQFPFMCVYLLYFASYAYFAGLGIEIARLTLRARLPAAATLNTNGRLAWVEAVRTSFMGVITSAIATYFASRLGAGG